MRLLAFSKRCIKEILRDPLNLLFGIGFPVVLLLLLSAIQANVPVPLFEIQKLAPGISVFGLSFITLFSATLIARDRESAFLQRLYTTPLKPIDYILGYMAPLVPISAVQGGISYMIAIALGLPVTGNILIAIMLLVPISIFYIGLGLLCGSILNTKQVGGICGALLTNLSAWLSGIWFDLELVGGGFRKIANLLPFVHAVELQRNAITGNPDQVFSHFLIVLLYATAVTLIASYCFMGQMKNQ